MYILNPQTLMIRDFESDGKMPFSKGHIFCIKQDYDNNLWIGTSMGIFCYKDGKRIAHYTSANSKLPDGNVYESILILRKRMGLYGEWDVHMGSFYEDIKNRCLS